MPTEEQIKDIIMTLEELGEDPDVPKNVKGRFADVIRILKGDVEISIRINRVFDELDDITNDSNLQPYTRTQIWNIVSMLENSH